MKKKVSQGFEYLGEHTVKNITEPVIIYRVLLAPESEGKVIGEPKARSTPIKKPTAIVIAMILIASVVLFWIVYSPPSGRESPSITKETVPKLEKASIAVLPFDNMSNDPEQAYFSDGISEDFITDLSKISGLFVIARISAFTYKGKSLKVQQIGEELGVRYVFEGSVRKPKAR